LAASWLAIVSGFWPIGANILETTAMVPFFVQFKCKLGQSYAVANALAEAEIAETAEALGRAWAAGAGPGAGDCKPSHVTIG
jgi:hypothetical protein